MAPKPSFKRRQYFIKKSFQTKFFLKFLILIFLEVGLAIAAFAYISKGTVTTGYVGDDLMVQSTTSFFLPTLTLFNFIAGGIIGLTGIAVFIMVSHKIAGPLFRFEKSLAEISKGDLSHRIFLRDADQLAELVIALNKFATAMDGKIIEVKSQLSETLTLHSDFQSSHGSSIKEKEDFDAFHKKLSEKLAQIQNTVDFFKVTKT